MSRKIALPIGESTSILSPAGRALAKAGLALLNEQETIRVKYKYRGCPCNICDGDPWAVCGRDNDPERGGGGVLEWCYSKDDARYIISLMEKDTGRFSDLNIMKPRNYKRKRPTRSGKQPKKRN